MTIDPLPALIGLVIALTSFVTAGAFWVRERAKSRSYTERARSDANTLQEKSRVDRDNALIAIATQGVAIQQSMIDAVNQNARAFTDQTRAANEYAAEMRGMMTILSDNTKTTHNTALSVDEMQGHIQADIKASAGTLQTELEGSMTDQFGPVVTELKGISTLLSALANKVDAKDEHMNEHITSLIALLQGVETRLMKALEPIILKHLAELLPNGSHTEKDIPS